jgi:hypothetical protein
MPDSTKVLHGVFCCGVLLSFLVPRIAVAQQHDLAVNVTCGAPVSVSNGYSTPFLTAEQTQTTITVVAGSPQIGHECQLTGGPTYTCTILDVKYKTSSTAAYQEANGQGYSASIVQTPGGHSNSFTMNFTGQTCAFWQVTVSATAGYTGTGPGGVAEVWDNSSAPSTGGTVPEFVTGNWALGPNIYTPTQNTDSGVTYLDDRGLTPNTDQADPVAYGSWQTFTDINNTFGILFVSSRADGFTNHEPSGSITPAGDPQSGSLSEQEVWSPTGSTARAATFEYAVQLDTLSSAAVHADISNGELSYSSGATAAGINATIVSSPNSTANSIAAIAEAQRTQGSDGTMNVSAGPNISWPPGLGVNAGTTFKSSTWGQSASLNPVQALLQNSVNSLTQNTVTVKSTLLASGQLSWSGDAGGPLYASAMIFIDTFTLNPFTP